MMLGYATIGFSLAWIIASFPLFVLWLAQPYRRKSDA